jgi:hypothetical protein
VIIASSSIRERPRPVDLDLAVHHLLVEVRGGLGLLDVAAAPPEPEPLAVARQTGLARVPVMPDRPDVMRLPALPADLQPCPLGEGRMYVFATFGISRPPLSLCIL